MKGLFFWNVAVHRPGFGGTGFLFLLRASLSPETRLLAVDQTVQVRAVGVKGNGRVAQRQSENEPAIGVTGVKADVEDKDEGLKGEGRDSGEQEDLPVDGEQNAQRDGNSLSAFEVHVKREHVSQHADDAAGQLDEYQELVSIWVKGVPHDEPDEEHGYDALQDVHRHADETEFRAEGADGVCGAGVMASIVPNVFLFECLSQNIGCVKTSEEVAEYGTSYYFQGKYSGCTHDILLIFPRLKCGILYGKMFPGDCSMMISTKGRNALRIMIDLAQHQDDGNIPLRDIATRQNASLKYLEAIAGKLSKKELITARHGKNGGYQLTRSPADISAGEILRAAEGELKPVACAGTTGANCAQSGDCLTYPLWQKLDEKIYDFLDSVSLEDIMTGHI